ncbi:CHAD domain-containing protein [Acinetobacter sp.]|uniref:CYTH and CHAD domain-containing protein n=1 Tax=Acinetobacter sp. TaxID=472 RepID=UPI0031D8543F
MHEIELKLQIPAHNFDALNKAFLTKTTQEIDLHARYFDTEDCLLAKNLMAIRIRKENTRWIQTFKSSGESHLQRFEHEFDLGSSDEIPNLNLDIYQQHPQALKLLNQALGSNWQQLQLQFETIVHRRYRLMNVNGSKIEVCLDLGTLKSLQQERPIQEIEFELKSGDLTDLIDLTSQWVNRYHLWLDVRSKAERGHLLAQGKLVSPATTAKALQLDKASLPENALKAMIANSLEQILPNVAAIAEQIAEPAHIHQARVGIRRLRSALQSFSAWSKQIDPAWAAQVTELFRQLGTSRDETVVYQEILPKVIEAGFSIDLAQPTPCTTVLAQVFQDPITTQLWLDLLDFAYTPSLAAHQKKNLKKKADKVLTMLHGKILKNAIQYQKLSIEQKHRLRKQLKRLRYSIEFVKDLYPEHKINDYLEQLAPVQNALGQYNDTLIAEHVFKQNTQKSSSQTSAINWLKGQHPAHEKQVLKKLKKFIKLKPIWN